MNYQRETDIKIVAIHDRLDKLETIADDLREIKEWIDTVMIVTRFLEMAGCFISKWTCGTLAP